MSHSNTGSLTRKTKKDDVEALLSDFDNLETKRTTGGAASNEKATPRGLTGKKTNTSASTKDDAQLLLDDLDDLVKQRRAPTPKRTLSTKTPSTSVSRTASTDNFHTSNTAANDASKTSNVSDQIPPSSDASSNITLGETGISTSSDHAASASGSWGGWWSSATKFADQARAELEKRAAQVQSQINLPWQSAAQNINAFLKSHGGDLNKIRSDIGKVGMKRWNEILNVVVPPIESHEVLSITLSHDMLGFEGVPDVVFQILQRVMETHAASQHAEQQLVVNKAPERRTESATKSDDNEEEDIKPDMRPVVGFSEAWKLAESRLEELVNNHKANQREDSTPTNDQSATLPITTCPLFIRIQPVLDVLPGLKTNTLSADSSTHLYICIILRDPTNNLSHRTVSQPLPKPYALLPFDQHPWAEELLSESLQNALGSVGLEYVRSRMQAQSEALSKAAEADETDGQQNSNDV
ncbi:uncharacterized protein FA14DRAFT_142409 [Meira miltonrushii]|uniref:Maintenance of telomere capping protein 1 n=1 Tax=Meira miltonrushii TaxID=1280837 RepID=A0A316VJG9_9BASI|nr:uncharacterized protein FA14DRAFT_142409 [Meira miltonrushii]PWN37827.1 hypothetical protein FA14DRAFT_142409 [Meira miltonrushii]